MAGRAPQLLLRGPVSCGQRPTAQNLGECSVSKGNRCVTTRAGESELQTLLFIIFLSMHMISVFENLLTIIAAQSDSHLHTPMYFFLSNLSFVDLCFTSTTIPKMLWSIQTQNTVTVYEGCSTHIHFFFLFVGLDILLLTVMADDRFVAICRPLLYTVIMSPWLCALLVLVSWVIRVLHSLLESLSLLRPSFCTFLEIPHFFCELSQMIQLASSDTFINNVVMLRVYLSSAATCSSNSSSTASVMYTVVTLTLNLFIYSLRNRNLKRGLNMFFGNVSIKAPVVLGLKKYL
ncbi:olfactory receptor-like protein OLF4 [Moschus berezovskii]|uniref:olfactory receptor-like protein OLF4 n=1 Tax=Moschus berezovskii TaxID=68408 RepID=UPI0024440CA6|nr:olfactory receptor-like protein OLF4 [Moschus berezovskii]